jgi:hypothetical protein
MINVSNNYFILVERKWFVFFNLWKKYRLLTFGSNFLIPFIDSIKKDKGGKPVQFSTKEIETDITFTALFKNCTKLNFQVKVIYEIKQLDVFSEKIQSVEDIHEHIYEELKTKLVTSIQKMEIKHLYHDIFKVWLNKDKFILEEYGIRIKTFDILDLEVVKNIKTLTFSELEKIINLNMIPNGKSE